jgi:hypothetical protein
MLANVETAPDLPPPRAFGREPGDLDLDFSATDRLHLATALVAACSSRPCDPERAWALPVGTRIERLLRIVALTEESDALPVALRCPAAECGKTLEVNLPFDRLPTGTSEDVTVDVPLASGNVVRLRRPTGSDQQTWRTQTFRTQRDALAGIVATLTVSATNPLDDDALAPLSAAMESFDPLTAFRVSTECPYCGEHATILVDLEAEALRHLASHRRALLLQIHALATQYGWSEAAILAVPPRRRARYLQLIEAAHPRSP